MGASTIGIGIPAQGCPNPFLGIETSRSLSPGILDIIGNSVYLLHANLYHHTKQTSRVPRCDWTDARRVCASAPGVCARLCGAVSVGSDLGGQAAPTSSRWWGHRSLATDGRQTAF